ncbi:MAG: hypothetical protein U5K31_14605 [Balneolaceae bacterium]|nr:hypothetical protein [Balneolaceae bacterium]
MNVTDIDPGEVRKLTGDIAYLTDEAEALRHVIDAVPVHEAPPGGSSIAEKLLLIDHAQCAYYRPLLEEARGRSKPLSLDDFDSFRETFGGATGEEGAENLLRRLAEHRTGLVNVLGEITHADWEAELHRGKEKMTLFSLMQEMVRFERKRLKEVADLVMVFNQDRQARREIEQRRERERRIGED